MKIIEINTNLIIRINGILLTDIISIGGIPIPVDRVQEFISMVSGDSGTMESETCLQTFYDNL